jgi:hypothetical protein
LIVHLFVERVIATVKAYPASPSGHLLTLLSFTNEEHPSSEEVGGMRRYSE